MGRGEVRDELAVAAVRRMEDRAAAPAMRAGFLHGKRTLVATAAVGLGGIVVLLVATVAMALHVDGSSRLTLANFVDVLGDTLAYQSLLNTLEFAVITTIVSVCFGLPIAWLAEKSNLAGRTILYPMMTIGILVPGFFNAMGWLFLLHPRVGTVNLWLMSLFGWRQAPFDVTSVPGMAFVQGLGLSSVIFIMCVAAFRAMDSSLEESAQIHGLSLPKRLMRITLPLLWPSILAAMICVFMIAIAVFDVPAIIGLASRTYTYSTFVYTLINPFSGLPNYGKAAASSVVVIVIALLLGAWYFAVVRRSYRYAVVTGKSYRPERTRLGRRGMTVAWIFVGSKLTLSLLLPGCMLIWASLLPTYVPFSFDELHRVSLENYVSISWRGFWHAASNSLIVTLVAPTLTMIVALPISWIIVRSGFRSARYVDALAFLPNSIPQIVFAVGAIGIALTWLPPWVPFYGTVAIIIFVQVVVQISFSTRILNGALIQLHRELDESASVFGIGQLVSMRRILIPLLAPAIAYTWIWVALLDYRDLTVSTMLVTHSNVTLPVFIWSLVSNNLVGQASAMTIIVTALMAPAICLYFYIISRNWRFSPS